MDVPSVEILGHPVNDTDCFVISQLITQVVPGFRGDIAANLATVTQNPNARLLVARSDNPPHLIVGLAVLNLLSKVIGREGRLNDLVVNEPCRERGYGSVIVKAAVDEARNAGAYKLEVTCDPRITANTLFRADFELLDVNRYTLYID